MGSLNRPSILYNFMTIRISQMTLVSQILRAIEQQAEDLGVKGLCIGQRQFNAIIDAATKITLALDRESVMATPGMGVHAWLASDDTGLSSKCMARVLCGVGDGGREHPLDAADFGRCYRFLQAVRAHERLPNWKFTMSGVGPAWARLMEEWSALTELFEAKEYTRLSKRIYELTK
jgi:hypothetical protein